MRYSHLLLAFVFIFSIPKTAMATHIVGGEMNYTCLGNNQYEITLTIFRDCFNGNPNAWFDDPAAIGLYNSDNVLIDSIFIELIGNDTLNPILSDDCLVVPPNVCVHTTTYTTTTTLPPLTGGYELRYQRCCRNETIVNIIDPLDAGATYSVLISENALQECNSSAKFQAWPPIYICVNEPISFDQSALDIDGDSIAYKLCTPLLGANPDTPQPAPWEQTNPVELLWQPPYSLDNVLGGTPLFINPLTGLLTGTPNTVGQFVVGICLEEYRDGNLISTTRRDFQYNVGICGQSLSAFAAPAVQCDGFTVDFDNQSENANDFIWYFNDPNNPGANSILEDPSYTYSDTGLYTIVLIAEPGNSCVDTFFADVHLKYNSLFADFDYEFIECTDSLVLSVSDLSYDTIANPIAWEWELSDGQSSEVQFPTFVIDATQGFTINLTVTSETGCTQSISETFDAIFIEVELIADTISICPGDSLALNPTGDPNYVYQWSPLDNISDVTSPNPTVYPEMTTTYSVSVTNVDSLCEAIRTVTVLVPEELIISTPNDTTVCSTDFDVSVSTNTGESFYWFSDPDFNNLLGTDSILTVTPFGQTPYYILVRDSFGCPAFDSIYVTGQGINTAIDSLEVICEEEITEISVSNIDPVDTLSYSWSPVNQVLSGVDSTHAVVAPPMAGTFTYYVDMVNQFGCIKQDSIQVGVIDTMPQDFFVDYNQCSGYSVDFYNTSINAPYYVWDFGDTNNPNSTSTDLNPTYTYSEAGTYIISLMINYDVNCPDTIQKEVTLVEPNIIPAFIYTFEECGDSAVVVFTDLTVNNQSTITSWEWIFSNGETANIQNPTLIINESTEITATLIVSSDDGCEDIVVRTFEVDLIDDEIEASINLCPGDEVPLNPIFNPSYDYQWTPTTGLDDATAPNPIASPDTTTTYTVTISNLEQDSCQIVQQVTLIVSPEIQYLTNVDTTLCDPAYLLFVESEQADSINWWEESMGGLPFSNEPEVLVEPGRPSIYFLEVIDEFGCHILDTIVVSSFAVDVNLTDLTICEPAELFLSLENLNPSDILNFSWSPSEAILSGGNTSFPNVLVDETTLFTVEVSNQLSCSLVDSLLVTVTNIAPPLNITTDRDTLIEGQVANLLATLSTSYDYTWMPAISLDDAFIYNPVASPEETTLYELTIVDEQGCTSRDSILIHVLNLGCDEPFIFIPNAFTPNGDGENDELKVFGNHIDRLHLAIFNRWGEKVFEAFDQASAVWDGTYKGEALTPDVFGFYLQVDCLNGDTYLKKGNITLLK